MTVIVWDGHTLAVDRAAVRETTTHRAPKSWVSNNSVLAGTGTADEVRQLVEWYKNGANKLLFPKYLMFSHNPPEMVTVDASLGLTRYSQMETVVHGFNACAFGDGADFAYGALACGASASKAALAACKFSTTCSPPIDVYTFGGAGITVTVLEKDDD